MPATNAWDEAKPAGSDLASTIDNQMRQLKLDIRERLALEHYWNTSLAADGLHKEITITPATTNAELLKTVSNQSLTGSSAVSAINIGVTWNTSGTPTAWKLNVTDTASNAASLLLDLQVGGVSQFKVSKTGVVTATGSLSIPGVALLAAANAFTGSVQFTANVSYPGGGSISKHTSNGLMLGAVTGSVFDFAVTNPSGASAIIYVPTGTLNVTFGGLVIANGAGTSTFTAGHNGQQIVEVVNTTSNTAALSRFLLTAGTATGGIYVLSQGYTTSGTNVAAGLVLNSTGAGGISIATTDTSAAIRFYTGTTPTLRGQFTHLGAFEVKNGSTTIVQIGLIGGDSEPSVSVASWSNATGRGSSVSIDRNTGGSTAAGILALCRKDGTFSYLWADSTGKLRIHTAPPTADGGVSDTAGTVVGTQS